MNSSPFSITLNLLSVAEAPETFDDEEGDFLFIFRPERFFLLIFLSISSEYELEDVLCLLFLDFPFCLNTFLYGEGFAAFALPTTFSAGFSVSNFTSLFPLFLIISVHNRGNKVLLRTTFLFRITI